MKLCVTGHDEHGKAVFSYVGEPPRKLAPGSYDIWSTQGPVRVPDDADPKAPTSIGYFPISGETSFKFFSVAPSAGAPAKVDVPDEISGLFEDGRNWVEGGAQGEGVFETLKAVAKGVLADLKKMGS